MSQLNDALTSPLPKRLRTNTGLGHFYAGKTGHDGIEQETLQSRWICVPDIFSSPPSGLTTTTPVSYLTIAAQTRQVEPARTTRRQLQRTGSHTSWNCDTASPFLFSNHQPTFCDHARPTQARHFTTATSPAFSTENSSVIISPPTSRILFLFSSHNQASWRRQTPLLSPLSRPLPRPTPNLNPQIKKTHRLSNRRHWPSRTTCPTSWAK